MIGKPSFNFYSSLSNIESSQCPALWLIILIVLSSLMDIFWLSTMIESASPLSIKKL